MMEQLITKAENALPREFGPGTCFAKERTGQMAMLIPSIAGLFCTDVFQINLRDSFHKSFVYFSIIVINNH